MASGSVCWLESRDRNEKDLKKGVPGDEIKVGQEGIMEGTNREQKEKGMRKGTAIIPENSCFNQFQSNEFLIEANTLLSTTTQRFD